MSNKIIKPFGVIFALLTSLSLLFPLYKATFNDGESMTVILRGYDLSEFSIWGVAVMFVPIVLIVAMLLKLKEKVKTVIVVSAFALGNASVYVANDSMYEWLCNNVTGTVNSFNGLNFYVAFLLCASVFCFMCCIDKKCNSKTENKKRD